MKIDWTKYFDAIWCLDYKPHVSRKKEIKKEFDRIGISEHQNFKFHETFPSPYDQYLYDYLKKDGKLLEQFSVSPGNMNASFGHYAIIKKSLLDNYNRVLIIENDMRFLKDVNIIKNTLEYMPDYDIILFDYFIHCSMDEFKNYKKINDYYSEYENLASVGCYSLTKKAMIVFEKLYELKIFPPDVYTSKFNFNTVLKKAFTPINLACQITYKDALNCTKNNNGIHDAYKLYGLDYEKYNMVNNRSYKYGDSIE